MDTQPRIILVDDDNDDISLLLEAIRQAGFSGLVKSFEESQKFLDYYRQCVDGKVPNVVVLDWNMPVMSGAEVMEVIAREFPQNLSSIVVFSTSKRHQDEVEARGWGAEGYYTKPHRFEDLVSFARKLLVNLNHAIEKQHQDQS